MGLKRADEIRTRMESIRADLATLEQLDRSGEADEAAHQRLDDLLAEADLLAEELKPLAEREERIARVQRASLNEANHDEPVDEPHRSERSIAERGVPELGRRRSIRNPYENLDAIRAGLADPADVRARAVAAIEQYANRTDHWALAHDGAEQATKLVEKTGARFGTAVARQMLITGTPEYLAAFQSYMEDPGGMSSRAALSLTPANGGYLVPFTLDPTIILTNNGSANPYRAYATIKTTATNDWNGVTSAGVSAEWTAEGIEAADATPTVGQLKITPQKADAYLFGSYEVLGDSDIAQQLPELLADAKDRLEESAFAVGTGTGQPNGVLARGTTLAAAAGTAATGPTAASVYSLMGALPARWRGPRANNVWLANLTTINALRNVPSFTGSTTSIVNDSGPVPTLLGKPLLESTSVAGAFANGAKVLAFGDMRQYYIVDRVGMSVVYDPVVLGANRRPTGQGAWYAFWRVGADVSTAGAFRVLTLTT
ncbi:phage major capsid protein [Micromonospora inyonensis]|uniref:Phage major capsid protein, HK97 family n=1 Tax=Micromonospora inyonensis TaxID=47866 RepID=A0A1C6RXD8_9ACTN|nr:phage major capsid protein [Micromonospora inyonensis]SCL21691.1 phage major capsid protein, HK97 family [Micromonospora inyonensis]